MPTAKETLQEKNDAQPCTKQQLHELNHQLANNRIVINWSAYALSHTNLAQQERQLTEDMLVRNCSAILVLFTELQTCLQELSPSGNYHQLFSALTGSVTQLQVIQTSQYIAEFEMLTKQLKQRMAPHLKD